jgi:pimeloyl-ACP methyl ester carboxylesterase
MTPSLPFIVAVFAAPAADLPTELWQLAPEPKGKPILLNNPRSKDRALLLIPGLKFHPLKPSLSTRPELHNWQEPNSELVRTLAKDFDVYGFGYAQTVPLDAVAQSAGLREAVERIQKAGYKEIVLVGHSAGGVIARLFVENHPNAGVTKVVTVAAPHTGAELANLKVGYSRTQAQFIQSLAPEARTESGFSKIGEKVEVACVVCKLKRIDADGLVNIASQWPTECQKNGVPAVLVQINHFEAMLKPESVKVIAEVAREKLTRWSAEEVEKAKKVLFRDPDERPSFFRREKE